jgi:voltage-gated potassium channel
LMNSHQADRDTNLAGRIERIMEIPMLILAIVYVPAFVVGYLPNVSPQVRRGANLVELLIVVVFVLEFALRLVVADRRLVYLRAHWLDLIIIVVPFLRPLRILLVLPFLAKALLGLRRVMDNYRGAYVLLVGILTTFAGAGLMFPDANPKDPPS